MRHKLVTVSVAIGISALALASLSACRSPRRGVRVGNDAATVKVNMVIPEADKGRQDWVYELSGCISPLNGQLGESSSVSFTSIGLRKDLVCQFRVKTLGAPPAGITFLGDSEPGVYYWARDVRIDQAPTGGLEATAGLQRLYEITPTGDASLAFTLKVPVKFKQPETKSPITAELECTPAIGRTALYPTDNPVDGEFSFSIAIDRDTPFGCTQLRVHAGGTKDRYVVSIPASAGQFTGVPGQTVTLSAVLELQLTANPAQPPPPPGTDDGVAVEVTPTDCGAGTVFDTVKKDCVPKP